MLDFFLPFERRIFRLLYCNNSVFLLLRMHKMDRADPDCPSIANGAQAAHVTGTSNVYRMDRSVFQVLQERSPACQDCRCGKRPCAGHTASSSCATFARNARVWRQSSENDLRHDLVWEKLHWSHLRFRQLNEYPRGRARACIPFVIDRRLICHMLCKCVALCFFLTVAYLFLEYSP